MITAKELSRVAVVGTSCAGKSTLAAAMAEYLAAPLIELDALHWGPNWTPRPGDVFRAAVDEATSQPHWICAGNYRPVRDLVWRRATSIVWLDYPFPLVFRRALGRTLSRCIRRTAVCGGNRETFRKSFLSGDSVLLWVIQSHWRNQRTYVPAFAEPEHAHARVVRLRSAAEASRFLEEVRQLPASAVSGVVADPQPNLID